MAAVGIGGVFFRATDPDGLRKWYAQHLGLGSASEFTWAQQAGPLVFMPFQRETDYFPAESQFMLNVRVEDLAGMIAALEAAGIAVTTDSDWDSPETGRFARIHDPEGNPVELWEAPAD